jgi:hypothetical protein
MVHADKLNFNCMGDQLLCTEVATGRVVWSQKLDGDLKEEGGYLAAPNQSWGRPGHSNVNQRNARMERKPPCSAVSLADRPP